MMGGGGGDDDDDDDDDVQDNYYTTDFPHPYSFTQDTRRHLPLSHHKWNFAHLFIFSLSRHYFREKTSQCIAWHILRLPNHRLSNQAMTIGRWGFSLACSRTPIVGFAPQFNVGKIVTVMRLTIFRSGQMSAKVTKHHTIPYVTYGFLLVCFTLFDLKNVETLKSASEVTHRHWRWYHSIDYVWYPITVLYITLSVRRTIIAIFNFRNEMSM